MTNLKNERELTSNLIKNMVSTLAVLAQKERLLNSKVAEYDEIITKQRSALQKIMEKKCDAERLLQETSEAFNNLTRFYARCLDEQEQARTAELEKIDATLMSLSLH